MKADTLSRQCQILRSKLVESFEKDERHAEQVGPVAHRRDTGQFREARHQACEHIMLRRKQSHLQTLQHSCRRRSIPSYTMSFGNRSRSQSGP